MAPFNFFYLLAITLDYDQALLDPLDGSAFMWLCGWLESLPNLDLFSNTQFSIYRKVESYIPSH